MIGFHHIFPPREVRIRYLGCDDGPVLLVGIPLLAALATLLFIANSPFDNHQLFVCLGLSLMHTTVYWITARALVIWLRQRYPGQRETAKRIGWMIVLVFCLVLFVEGTLNGYVFPRSEFLQRMHYGEASFAFEVSVALTLCTMVLAVYESVYFFRRYQSSLVEQERLSRANVQAQLDTLKQQTNPHFLFNSLNTLVQIIPEDPEKAVLFTQRLSAVYRRILEYRHRELIPLSEEMEALRDYVFLMQTRFEDKLRVEWVGEGSQVPYASPDERPARYVVPLSLQLLVENALKHNVISNSAPLTVTIAVSPDTVTVTNDLRPRTHRESTTGWGQENIRRRFRLATRREVTVERTDTYYRVTLPLLTEQVTPDYAIV